MSNKSGSAVLDKPEQSHSLVESILDHLNLESEVTKGGLKGVVISPKAKKIIKELKEKMERESPYLNDQEKEKRFRQYEQQAVLEIRSLASEIPKDEEKKKPSQPKGSARRMMGNVPEDRTNFKGSVTIQTTRNTTIKPENRNPNVNRGGFGGRKSQPDEHTIQPTNENKKLNVQFKTVIPAPPAAKTLAKPPLSPTQPPAAGTTRKIAATSPTTQNGPSQKRILGGGPGASQKKIPGKNPVVDQSTKVVIPPTKPGEKTQKPFTLPNGQKPLVIGPIIKKSIPTITGSAAPVTEEIIETQSFTEESGPEEISTSISSSDTGRPAIGNFRADPQPREIEVPNAPSFSRQGDNGYPNYSRNKRKKKRKKGGLLRDGYKAWKAYRYVQAAITSGSLLFNPYVATGIGIIILIFFILWAVGAFDTKTKEDAAKESVAVLTIEKRGPPSAAAGTEITYDIIAKYPGTAQDIIIRDRLPDGVDYAPKDCTVAKYDPATRTVTWSAKEILSASGRASLNTISNVNMTLKLSVIVRANNVNIVNQAEGEVIGGGGGAPPDINATDFEALVKGQGRNTQILGDENNFVNTLMKNGARHFAGKEAELRALYKAAIAKNVNPLIMTVIWGVEASFRVNGTEFGCKPFGSGIAKQTECSATTLDKHMAYFEQESKNMAAVPHPVAPQCSYTDAFVYAYERYTPVCAIQDSNGNARTNFVKYFKMLYGSGNAPQP